MIRNIWAVGRNYAEHAKELGNEVPTEPLIFLKAGSCATFGEQIRLPAWAAEIHHELEIAFEFDLQRNFSRVGLALDLTERAAQNRLKAKGQPWTLAKSFAGSCPLSPLVPLSDSLDHLPELRLQFFVNGQCRQDGLSSQMIFSPAVLREYVLHHYPVEPGDLLLTGTPSGVGPLKSSDRAEACLRDNLGRELVSIRWSVL